MPRANQGRPSSGRRAGGTGRSSSSKPRRDSKSGRDDRADNRPRGRNTGASNSRDDKRAGRPKFERGDDSKSSFGKRSSGPGREAPGRRSSSRSQSEGGDDFKPSYGKRSSSEKPSFGKRSSGPGRAAPGRRSSSRSQSEGGGDFKPSYGKRPSFGKPSFGKRSSGDSNRSSSFDKRKRSSGEDFSKERRSSFSSGAGRRGSSDSRQRRSFDRDAPRTERSRNTRGEKPSRNDKGFFGKQNREEKDYDRSGQPDKAPIQTEKIRLNRFIANSGVCSRREADELISMGLIAVNGKTITELGYKVNPGDEVRYENKVLRAEKPVYILLNKPKGYLTTTDDPQERKTVMHLIGSNVKERIYPVGRLDRNTTGLLLLTNDGDLADKLMHPSYEVKKIYKVELDRPLTKADFETIKEGVRLDEGRAAVDDIAIVSDDGKTVGLEIHIGWNRVVRRIFESLEYEVLRLDRSVYAGLDKKDLSRGQWRFLTKEEIVRLKHFK